MSIICRKNSEIFQEYKNKLKTLPIAFNRSTLVYHMKSTIHRVDQKKQSTRYRLGSKYLVVGDRSQASEICFIC